MSGTRPSGQVRFSSPAILLHWTIAILIALNFAIGLQFSSLKGMALFDLMQWHKSFGISVLVLSFLRLAWRFVRAPPPYPPAMAAWEKAAAAATHWGFYALMIGLPLSGWIIVSASPLGIPTLLFKTIPWPHVAAIHNLPLTERKEIADNVSAAHAWLAWGGAALLVLHVGAALKHHLAERDDVLWRMAPIPILKPRARPSPVKEI